MLRYYKINFFQFFYTYFYILNICLDNSIIYYLFFIKYYKIYYNIVLEKYKHRIERFYQALHSDQPLIVLMRELFRDVMLVKEFLEKKFNKKNIMFVVATEETGIVHLPPLMRYFNPNGNAYHDRTMWKSEIEPVKRENEYIYHT